MRGFVQDIFPKIADSPGWIPFSLLLVPLPVLTGEDLRGANWNAIEDDCDFRRNDAVDPSTEFTYWRPANTSLNDVSGTCGCEFVSKLFPVFYSARDSDDFIAEACERCIKDGRFTFNEDEIKDVEQFMQRAGLSEPLMLRQFVEIMERHPRPAWRNIHHKWPFHCRGITTYVGELNSRDFLVEKPPQDDDHEWFQHVLRRGDPSHAEVIDV